jgi:aryl-alcohol dehydrogenase-like predicted oxidoreductase/predicted kinase
MRLSTDPRRDEDRSLAVLRAAIDAGANLFDTADAYAHDDADRGHNEHLIARAIGDRDVFLATKGGFVRPNGTWVPDGRARHLREACEASLRALGRIDLYQLHAPDPRVPFATSVRAIAKLKEEGLVARIGVCNVSAALLREACDLAPIDAVQIALSPFDDGSFRSGVPAMCRERGLMLLAHSPLGGPRRAKKLGKDPLLAKLAIKHGVSAQAIAIAWLCSLGVIPIPGATTEATASDAISGAHVALDAEDLAALEARYAFARPRPPLAAPRDGEVVLLMGMPGAGKTTRVKEYVDRGYTRFNRDERGGTLKKVAAALDTTLASGVTRAVLDNTYARRASRDEVIEVAHRHALPVRCVWIDTPIEAAQINACERMIARYGRLLGPDEIQRASKDDPNTFDPRAQHRYRRELDPPDPSEGYTSIDRVELTRARDVSLHTSATIVSLDAIASLDPLRIDLDRLAKLRATDTLVLATAWTPDPKQRAALSEAEASLQIPIVTCTHPAGPPICWCRKPLPGLAILLIRAHAIDPARSTWVGTSIADRSLAANVGFRYADADTFFSG